MIELSPATASMLYLCGTLLVLLGIWGSHHYRARKQKISLHEEELVVCEYCHYAYLAKQEKPVNKCPQCHSFNKNNRYKGKGEF